MKNELTTNPGGNPATTPALLDSKQCAALLGCSARHWTRLVDMGKAPSPIKLGALTKWRKIDLDAFIADGCRPMRGAR